jgi:ABC-2 type transport system ATP-binding protein
MDSAWAIRTTGLTKIFRDFWRRPKAVAVDGLDMDVQRGEIFGLLGPNGSGKSTTIKMLLGLLHPSAGSIEVLGRSPRDVAVKHRIGYLPEETYLYGYLTARETLDFYARLFDFDARERRRRIDELIEMVGLRHAERRRVGEFSKGMARRIGLAQALINDPQLIVLDEPTSGLDPVGCRQVKDLMLALARRGKTILLSSHLLADVENVCDRVAILYNGRMRAQGFVKTMLRQQDRMNMALPALSPPAMEKLLKAVRKIAGVEPAMHCATLSLEEYFLKVVAEANRTASERSGVAQSEQLADFLTRAGVESATGEPRP